MGRSPGPSAVSAGPAAVGADAVATAVLGYRFRHNNEYGLQEGVRRALEATGIDVAMEVSVTGGRIDALTSGGVGVEIKVAGTLEAVTRQLMGYAHDPRINSLVLVTTVSRHLAVPAMLAGVTVRVVPVFAGAFA